MTFIGIISDEKKEKYITEVTNKNLEHYNKVIFINKKNIDNIKNVKFETVLITENNDKLFIENELIRRIMQNAKYLIINSDMKTNLEMLKNLNINVITYGFNSKASITASSVTDENVLLCVQRDLQTIEGKLIEKQEIKVSFNEKRVNYTTYEIMGIASLLLIYGKKDVKI